METHRRQTQVPVKSSLLEGTQFDQQTSFTPSCPATMPQHRSTCSGHAFRRGKMEDLQHCYANDGVLLPALSGYLLEQMTV